MKNFIKTTNTLREHEIHTIYSRRNGNITYGVGSHELHAEEMIHCEDFQEKMKELISEHLDNLHYSLNNKRDYGYVYTERRD